MYSSARVIQCSTNTFCTFFYYVQYSFLLFLFNISTHYDTTFELLTVKHVTV